MTVHVTTETAVWCDYPKCDNAFERPLPRSLAMEDAFHAGWTGVGSGQFCPAHPGGHEPMDIQPEASK